MRAHHPPVSSPILLAGFVILAAACGGCGSAVEPVAPAPAPGNESALRAVLAGEGLPTETGSAAGSFYPLQLGNHWGYHRTFTVQVIPDVGPIPRPFVYRARRDRDLVCIEELAGRSYVVERRVETSGISRSTFWVLHRQDESGLYEADVALSQPPACEAAGTRRVLPAGAGTGRADEEAWTAVSAGLTDSGQRAAYRAAWERIQARLAAIRRAPGTGFARASRPEEPRGGVLPGEITRLEYPLYPGAAWEIRPDPRFASTVESAEALDLAIGSLPSWRIRIESELFGSSDRVHLWYGRSGFLALAAHFEGEATDEKGNRIGRLIAEESDRLVELSLSQGRFTP